MALRPPGSRSTAELLLSSAWTVVILLLFLGGNGALLAIAAGWFGLGGGLSMLAARTGWPAWAFVVLAVLGLAVDAWIVRHRRLERKRALER